MMLRSRLTISLAALAGLVLVHGPALLPAHAAADSIPSPVYEKGQAFIYTNRRVERFVSAEDSQLTWKSRSGRTFVRGRDFTTPNLVWESDDTLLRRHISGNANGLWPLKPGRSTRYSITTVKHKKNSRHDSHSLRYWSCKVHKSQTVQVQAGEFSVFPIVCNRYSAKSMRIVGRVTWHYAPAVGHYVKKTTTNFRSGQTKSFELVAALPPDQANRKRIRSILKTLR